MPRYDFRCRTCGATFELRRAMAQANDPAVCPQGHSDTTKLLSTIAITSAGSAAAAPQPAAGGGGGGCCGGGCCS
ncbi:zinc ribbon domain-containing protein [Kitasatospora sp. NPDC006697]|uniref:FmdB family zinc ribbon protein n=1 Tax=Kitasatospora sp. NPDC006697 TaxID=3364020 RepID=UPI003685DD33